MVRRTLQFMVSSLIVGTHTTGQDNPVSFNIEAENGHMSIRHGCRMSQRRTKTNDNMPPIGLKQQEIVMKYFFETILYYEK